MMLVEKTPLVSAVVTAYNNQATIGPAIESLMKQTLPDREIVVVDDGSRDNTRQVIASYGHAVRMICQENAGSAAARNRGIREARGRYVAFLDGDDVALPERLLLQATALEAEAGVGLVYGNIFLMDAGGGNLRLRGGTRRYRSGDVTRELAIRNFVPFSTIMVRRQLLLDAELFDESIRSSEDWDLLVRISHRCLFLYLDQPLTCYRVSAGSKTADLSAKEHAYRLVQSKIFAENDFGADTCRLRRLSDASLQLGLLSICLRYGKFKKAWRYLLRALVIAPDVVLHLRSEIGSRLLTPLMGTRARQ